MLTFDALRHADVVTGLLKAGLPPDAYDAHGPDEVPRNEAGFPLPGRYVEVLVSRREMPFENLRAGETSRRPMLISTTSTGTTYRECARLQRFVADVLQGARIVVQDVPGTPVRLDYADTPEQLSSGAWSAVDLWTYTH